MSVTSVYIDGASRYRTLDDQTIWISTSNIRSFVASGLTIALTAAALYALVIALNSPRLRYHGLSFLAASIPLTLCVASILRGDPYSEWLNTAVFALVVLAFATCDRADLQALLRPTAMVAATVSTTYLVSIFTTPEMTTTECRVDKCSVFGSLWHSYLPQENNLALYVAFSMMLSMALTSRTGRLLSVSLNAVLLLGTGSRTAIIAAAVGLVAVLIMQASTGPREKAMGHTARASLIVSSLAGLWLTATASHEAFTNRGSIYAIVRDGFFQSPLIGTGRETLTRAYNLGQTANFHAPHEHGQMPYLLLNGGALAVTLWLLLSIAWVLMRMKVHPSIIGITVVAAVAGLTEPVWEVSSASPYAWSVLLWVASLARERK